MADSNEAFDEFVASRIPAHEAAIKERLIQGDPGTISDIDTSLGVLLFSSASWAELIQKTAAGENAFEAVMKKAIFDSAEILAIKDAEQAERDRKEDI